MNAARHAVRFRLLGPLEVWDGAAWLPVRAAQQRLVLALLLIDAGRPVTVDRLVDEIWGEQPPRAATSVVRGYVMRLRKLLGGGTAGLLVTRQSGYELAIEDDQLDARAFDRLATSGNRALTDGDPHTAVAQLSRALALWRGPALADVPASPTVTAETTRLEQARLTVTESHLDARLDLGRHHDVIGELHRLVDEHPLRERLWEQLMVALHRSGRRGEALDAYRRARHALVTELGLEPGRYLRELQRAVLSDDHRPATSPPPGGPPVGRVTVTTRGIPYPLEITAEVRQAHRPCGTEVLVHLDLRGLPQDHQLVTGTVSVPVDSPGEIGRVPRVWHGGPARPRAGEEVDQ
jgi:DNA-binding SARP family transcriptional activator